MLLIRKLEHYQSKDDGIVLTIGNFDGIHLGHQEIIKNLKQKSVELGLPAAVMCFEPQPLEFFVGNFTPARLSRFRDKFIGLKKLGVDMMFCVRFNKSFAEKTPEDFIEEILHHNLKVKYLLVGDDFHFGKGGKGDFKLLQEYGKKLGFEVSSMSSFMKNSKRVSSTLIRQCLQNSELDLVPSLLGENFFIRGKVCHGQSLGRTINFPTANISLRRRVIPLFGVYAVTIDMPDGTLKYGLANLGLRPTVNGNEPRLEVYIFDFSGDLYTKEIKVSFVKKLRDETKFSSLCELKEQIKLDETMARKIFNLEILAN